MVELDRGVIPFIVSLLFSELGNNSTLCLTTFWLQVKNFVNMIYNVSWHKDGQQSTHYHCESFFFNIMSLDLSFICLHYLQHPLKFVTMIYFSLQFWRGFLRWEGGGNGVGCFILTLLMSCLVLSLSLHVSN